VQGSAIGPVTFVITASDLKPRTVGNSILKYADDTYLLIPQCNENSVQDELSSIEQWADINNLKLNRSKSQEIVMQRNKQQISPPVLIGIERVDSLKVLGVTLQSDLRTNQHISTIISKAQSDVYALKTLKIHGLDLSSLSLICRSTLINRLLYASPAWRGFCSVADMARLDSIERKVRKWGLYSPSSESFLSILDKADSGLFSKLTTTSNHVLQPYLPPLKNTSHNLRARGHPYTLPLKTSLSSNNFLTRLLYSSI